MPGFVTCGPNEALVISGCCNSKPNLMPGGRVFVWPWFQKIQKISLNTMTLTIESQHVYTSNGVPITLTGISQVKVCGNNHDKLRAASENFLGKTEAEIIKIVQETLEGHQREVMATFSAEKIYTERKQFSKKVHEIGSSDLSDMGLTVISYTVKDIHDEEGYLEALGIAQTAKVKMDGKVAEVEEFKDRKIKELNADKEHYMCKYRNDQQISKARHEFNLKKAEFDIAISQEKAKSDLANELQEEIGHIMLIRETKQVEAEQGHNFEEINKLKKEIREKELAIRVQKKAEKDLEKVKIISDAESAKIQAEADAEAEAIKEEGEAKAYFLQKVSTSQTDKMAREASVYADFSSAAKINMLLETLPKVAGEVCNPLTQCNKITMVSQGDGEVGVNKMVSEILNIITHVYTSVDKLSNMANRASYTNDDPPGDQPPAPPAPLERKPSSIISGRSSYFGSSK